MRYEIRAMSLGEILDTGFRLLRNHFVLFTSIGLVLYLPLAMIGMLVHPTKADPHVLMMLGVALLSLMAAPLMIAAITYAIGEVYLGRTATVGGAMRTSLGLFLPLAGTMILYGLAVLGGLIALVIPGIYLALCFMLVNQVIVLEGLSGTAALRRSRELMRGNIGRGGTVLLVASLLSGILSVGVGLLLHMAPSVAPLGNAVVQSVTYAYGSAVAVVLYFEIRSRKEAFDLEHLAQVVESQSSELAFTAS